MEVMEADPIWVDQAVQAIQWVLLVMARVTWSVMRVFLVPS